MLLCGGAIALMGLFGPGDPCSGIEVKRVGLVVLGTATAAYGVALCLLGPVGVVAGLDQ